MRSSEVAAAAGVNAETVRFVKQAQELGFTLDEVRELLLLADGGPADCDTARDLAQARVGVAARSAL